MTGDSPRDRGQTGWTRAFSFQKEESEPLGQTTQGLIGSRGDFVLCPETTENTDQRVHAGVRMGIGSDVCCEVRQPGKLVEQTENLEGGR